MSPTNSMSANTSKRKERENAEILETQSLWWGRQKERLSPAAAIIKRVGVGSVGIDYYTWQGENKKSSGRNRNNLFLHWLKTKDKLSTAKDEYICILMELAFFIKKRRGARVGFEKIWGVSHRPNATQRQLQRARQNLANAAPTYFSPPSANPVNIAAETSYLLFLSSCLSMFALLARLQASSFSFPLSDFFF